MLVLRLQARIFLSALQTTCHFEWGNDCHFDDVILATALWTLSEDNTARINKAILKPIPALLGTFNTASASF